MDFVALGAKHVMVLTDKHIAKKTDILSRALTSLDAAGICWTLFDDVRVEPNEESFQKAANFARKGGDGGVSFDAFLSVGGGSVMDTAKAAALYSAHPENAFLDFVNAPIGKGLPPPGPLPPHIAVPTTAGTGSETTGQAIFDLPHLGTKTGIGHRLLRPTLGIVDPDNTQSMPTQVRMGWAQPCIP
jgi:hydroxyacid-oxoacid transhydrogenase